MSAVKVEYLPICRPELPRPYTYKRRRRDNRLHPELRQLLIRWNEINVNQVVRVPGTYGRTSDYDLVYFGRHLRKYAIERGLWPGVQYGLMKDTGRTQCILLVKLSNVSGLPANLI